MNLLKNLASLTVLISSVSSTLTPEKLEISAAFPPDNQFGIVFNGQPNKILQVYPFQFFKIILPGLLT
jgi:hypothetical protein